MFTSKTSTVKRKTRGKTTTLLDLWRQRKKCYLDAKSRNSTLQNAALGSFNCFQDQNKREHAAGETSPANNLKDLLVPRIGPCTKGENMNTLTVEWSTKQVLSGTGRAEGKATRDRLSSLLSQSATIKSLAANSHLGQDEYGADQKIKQVQDLCSKLARSGGCVVCYARGSRGWRMHTSLKCIYGISIRRGEKLNLPRGTCFSCCIPQSAVGGWHTYQRGSLSINQCPTPDIVKPIVYALLHEPDLLAQLRNSAYSRPAALCRRL